MYFKSLLRLHEWLALALLVCVQYALVSGWPGNRHYVDGQPVLRVAAPKAERVSASLSPYGPGFEQELLRMFADEFGYVLDLREVTTAAEAWDALSRGDVDMVAGVGGEAPLSLQSPIVAGPVYATARPVLVHSSRRYALRDDEEICSNPILTTSQRFLSDALAEEGQAINCVPWTSSVDSVSVTPVLASVNDDRARFALVEDWSYSLWQPFFLGVKPTRTMEKDVSYRWFWRTGREDLHNALSRFWTEREEDQYLAALHERYFGFLPDEADYYDIVTLTRALSKALPRYNDTIVEQGQANGIDPLMLAAIIYQESRFDAQATSRTGVRGLMQITQNTARVLGVNRLDPTESIEGGARYLKMLWDNFESMELDPWDRWFFTLASYNQGLGHVYDAIALCRSMGGTGRTWHELKKTLPLLAWQKYYSQTKHGYSRGYEAVAYVENIRYYYYILHGLVSLSRPEAEYLGPLVSAIPSNWPII